jgi:acyl carrier protein
VSKGAAVTADANTAQPVTRAEILTLVQTLLAEILEKSPDEITEDAPFEALGADSLALIELVEALEDSLAAKSAGFHIDDEDLEALTSVRLSVDYVTNRLNAA